MYEYRCTLCGGLSDASPEWRYNPQTRRTHMTGTLWCDDCEQETVQNQTKQHL